MRDWGKGVVLTTAQEVLDLLELARGRGWLETSEDIDDALAILAGVVQ